MASPHSIATTPLTFELSRPLVDRIHACRGRLGLKSASEVVRRALEDFDFAAFEAPRREQCQISVRLSPARKRTLFRYARQHRVSAGELLRAALEAFSPGSRRAGGGRGQPQPNHTMPGKTAGKPAGKVVNKRPVKSRRR